MRVNHPAEIFQRGDFRFLRHDAENAWVDVPTGCRHDHVTRAFAEFLHRDAGAGRIIFDILAELFQIGPSFVPALDRIFRILIAEDVGQAHDEGAAGARVRRAGINEFVRIGLSPSEQFFHRGRRVLHLVGHIFEQRARGIISDNNALPLRQRLHHRSAFEIDRIQIRQVLAILPHDVEPELLLNASGERVRAGEHEIDIDAVRVLLRFDFARQFGSRCLGEGEFRNEVRLRLAIGLKRFLRERQIAGDVDDIDRDCFLWQCELGLRTRHAERGDTRSALHEAATRHLKLLHGLPPWGGAIPPFCLPGHPPA